MHWRRFSSNPSPSTSGAPPPSPKVWPSKVSSGIVRLPSPLRTTALQPEHRLQSTAYQGKVDGSGCGIGDSSRRDARGGYSHLGSQGNPRKGPRLSVLKIPFIRSSRIGWSQGNNPWAACKPAGQTSSYSCIPGEGADGAAGWQITQHTRLGRGLVLELRESEEEGLGFLPAPCSPACASFPTRVITEGLPASRLAGRWVPRLGWPRQSRTVCPDF